MSPRHLRAKAGVALPAMARALGMSPASLLELEATPTETWPLRVLERYVAACGHRLQLVAVRAADGRQESLR